MNHGIQSPAGVLTGRIKEPPNSLINEAILQPQFAYESEYLLPFYIQIEKVMVSEYQRLSLITEEEAQELLLVLGQIDKHTLTAEPQENMSDICFAIERYVESRLTHPIIAWHADRSRNDVQATAQLMFAREQLLGLVGELLAMADAVLEQAEQQVDLPMPGYTHYQSAQIITAGFYWTAVNERIGKTVNRLMNVYEELNECPLGAGAMAGLELAWDREWLAGQLGFARSCRHALVSVASREWMLHIGAELSTFSVTLSRFVTDLITWGSSEYRLMDLPDQLAGISSAMPQKKNFPILERIRGNTAHITAYYLDFSLAQRNTPFTNLVETSKEGGKNFIHLIDNVKLLFQLFTTVVEQIRFQEERTYQICSQEFFGGLTLANQLCFQEKIPYRKAQVIAGRYIVKMLECDRQPKHTDIQCLQEICEAEGYTIGFSESNLRDVFNVEHSIYSKKTLGSTNPVEIASLLIRQKDERNIQRIQWQKAVKAHL
ncbi:argininosuccinate lyase [Paenibacillus sp. sgz500958]|uniref:argininosuccinate lyase n=1 Tax=Paenibacillus sp. sgz500958 TaxID=3242475 RepID=UPI0036D2A300